MTLKSRFIALAAGLRSVAADIIPPHPFAFLATALAFVMVGGVCAFAQDGSAPLAAASFWDVLADTLTRVARLVESAAIILACVGGLFASAPLVNGVISLLGIKDAAQRAQFEKLLSDRLHSAVQNAIQYAVTRSGLPVSAVTVTTILSDAVAYLQDKNPDIIGYFELEVKQLEDLVTANWPNVFSWMSDGMAPAAGSGEAAEAAVKAGIKQALDAFDKALPARVQEINNARINLSR